MFVVCCSMLGDSGLLRGGVCCLLLCGVSCIVYRVL